MASPQRDSEKQRGKRDPTPFQKQILDLTLEEFRTQTNICELVQEEAFNVGGHTQLTNAVIDEYSAHYYKKLASVHKWEKCALKNLKFITPRTPVPETSSNTPSAEKPVEERKARATTKSTDKNYKMAAGAKKKNNRAKLTTKARVHDDGISYSAETAINEDVIESIGIDFDNGPSDFQTAICGLTFNKFASETNIREIARRELEGKLSKKATDEQIEILLQKYFDRRTEIETWWKCGLKNLKFHLCECKRNEGIKRRNVKVQKDIKMVNVSVQCDPDVVHHQHCDPTLTIGIQTMDFAEVRMSQLTERNETQTAERSSALDPLKSTMLASGILAVNNTPQTGAAPVAAVTPRPETMDQTTHDNLPLFVPIIIEVDDSEDEANADHDGYEVLLETTTQTQHFSDASPPNIEQPANPPAEEQTPVTPSDDVNVKDEPIEVMSISQINAKYAGDLVAEDIVPSTQLINDSMTTQQLFEQIIEIPGNGNMSQCTMDFPAAQHAAAYGVNDSSDQTQMSNSSNTQSSSNNTIGLNNSTQIVEKSMRRRDKPCPKSKKNAYVEIPEEAQSEPAAIAVIAGQDVERAMADLFADMETPQISPDSTENSENINPQLTSASAPMSGASINFNSNDKVVESTSDRLVQRSLFTTKKANRLPKRPAVNPDDTLSNIEPPKYNYNALLLVPKKRTNHIDCETNTVTMSVELEPNIEVDDTPPCIENSREFLIEDGSIDGDSQISQMAVHHGPSAASILNTGNSMFLSSQLVGASQVVVQQADVIESELFFTATDSNESECVHLSEDEIMIDNEVIVSEIIDCVADPCVAIPPPEKRRKRDTEATDNTVQADDEVILIDELEAPPPEKRRKNDEETTVDDVTIVMNPLIATDETNETEEREHIVSSTLHPNPQIAVVVAEPTPQTAPPTGFEWISQIPNSINYTYLHYIDIENVSYRYEVERLPSDVAYNICHQQEGLRTTINFKCDGLHRIEIKGECIQKLLKLKYTEWRAVQAVLELVKHFTYNSRAKEPKASSLLERSLHYLFASASKFSNVHIQRILYDEKENRDVCRVLDTTYELKPESKRLRSTIDPFVLDSVHLDSKRMRKN